MEERSVQECVMPPQEPVLAGEKGVEITVVPKRATPKSEADNKQCCLNHVVACEPHRSIPK